MKKLILILLFLSISTYAQSWNSIITTSISSANISHIENFANKDGIHLVVYRDIYGGNKEIDYYLINTAGTLIRSTLISTNGKYPNVVGDNNFVYLVYKEADKIRVKKSADAGQTWTDKSSKAIGNNPCSGVDAVFGDNGIHTVWSINNQNDVIFSEVYYEKCDVQQNNWVDFKNVTDYANGYGVYPTVSISANRVHVGYNSDSFYDDTYPSTSNANEMSRTKYNTTWQKQQQIASVSNSGVISTESNLLYDFYYDIVSGMGQYSSNLNFRYRTIGSSSWSAGTLLENGSDYTVPLSISETANGYVHVFNSNTVGKVSEDIIINGTINSIAEVSNGYVLALYSSAVYDDIYLNWRGYSGYVKLRQYDAAPETPQNFSATFTGTNPVISWSILSSPDIQNYKIDKRVIGETGWATVATVSSSTSSWTDVTVTHPHYKLPYYKTIEYRMRAVDNGGKYSNYSSVSSVVGYANFIWKISSGGSEENITTYKLFSNFPNPFNPSTNISFQLPQDAQVNLTVYNSLGQKVKELVNDNLSIGKYSVEFNAESASGSLPSGLYIYRLTTSGNLQNYSEVKKMLLLK